MLERRAETGLTVKKGPEGAGVESRKGEEEALKPTERGRSPTDNLTRARRRDSQQKSVGPHTGCQRVQDI